jgi:hypothetical protein
MKKMKSNNHGRLCPLHPSTLSPVLLAKLSICGDQQQSSSSLLTNS